MNDQLECFLSALKAFARLSSTAQSALISDVTESRESPPDLMAVRELLANAIDGCFDEEIADGLRYGAESVAD